MPKQKSDNYNNYIYKHQDDNPLAKSMNRGFQKNIDHELQKRIDYDKNLTYLEIEGRVQKYPEIYRKKMMDTMYNKLSPEAKHAFALIAVRKKTESLSLRDEDASSGLVDGVETPVNRCNEEQLKTEIQSIFKGKSSSCYTVVISGVKSEMRCLNKNSDKYKELDNFKRNIQIINPNSNTEGDVKHALIGIFNLIKKERHGETRRSGVDEKAVDLAMDTLMNSIKKQLSEETLHTLGLSLDEVTISSDTGAKAALDKKLKTKIDYIPESFFTNLRNFINHPNRKEEFKEFHAILQTVYDFRQGGKTTPEQFKNKLEMLVPLLYEKVYKSTNNTLKTYANQLHSELVGKIGKQELQDLGIADKHLLKFSLEANLAFNQEQLLDGYNITRNIDMAPNIDSALKKLSPSEKMAYDAYTTLPEEDKQAFRKKRRSQGRETAENVFKSTDPDNALKNLSPGENIAYDAYIKKQAKKAFDGYVPVDMTNIVEKIQDAATKLTRLCKGDLEDHKEAYSEAVHQVISALSLEARRVLQEVLKSQERDTNYDIMRQSAEKVDDVQEVIIKMEIDEEQLKTEIQSIFRNKPSYCQTTISRVTSVMKRLDKNSDKYKELDNFKTNIQRINPNGKVKGDVKHALIDIFNLIKKERYGETRRSGVNENAADLAMDALMNSIKKQLSKETLDTLGLSLDEVIISSDTEEEAVLDKRLKDNIDRIPESFFTNLRTYFGSNPKNKEEAKEISPRLKVVYDFRQGGLTTPMQFKEALKVLMPLLYAKAQKLANKTLKEYATQLHSELVDKIGKQDLQKLGIEYKYLQL